MYQSNLYFQILVAEHDHEFTWASCQGGEVPTGAIQGGVTGDAEKLFIGRAEHDGSLTIGKVHPSHKVNGDSVCDSDKCNMYR